MHIPGASGSGTTTLGRSLAGHLGSTQFDTDELLREPTSPPCQRPREVALREAIPGQAPDAQAAWVLSWSPCGWGDQFVPRFGGVIFLRLLPGTRLVRLRMREQLRHGSAAIAPGGGMHEAHVELMAWAARQGEGERRPEVSLARAAAFRAGIASAAQGAASTCTQ